MIELIIYVDVLLVLNAYVDYLLILSTEKLLKHKAKFYRRICGAFFGAISSLSIFIPIKSEILSLLIGIASAVIISMIGFGTRSVILTLKSTLIMYLLTCAYCGVMYLLWHLTNSNAIVIHNSVVYFNISPLFLIISTIVCYFIISIATRIINKHKPIPYCTVDITQGDKCISLRSIIDTGNTLHETLSGLPVVIIDCSSGYKLLGENLNSIDTDTLILLGLNGFRLIPCSSAVGKGCLPAFKPDNIILCNNGEYSILTAYVAVSNSNFNNGYSAIIGAQSIADKESLLCC